MNVRSNATLREKIPDFIADAIAESQKKTRQLFVIGTIYDQCVRGYDLDNEGGQFVFLDEDMLLQIYDFDEIVSIGILNEYAETNHG